MIRKLLKQFVDAVITFESYFTNAINNGEKKLILIRKDGLGDYIIFLPTIKYYKEIYPGHKIYLVVNAIAKDLIPKIDGVDEFIIYNPKKFSSNFFYRRKFLLGLKKGGYDIAIYPSFSREVIGDLMMRLTDARERIAFFGDNTCTKESIRINNNKYYTRLIAVPENIKTEFERNIFLINSLGKKNINISFPTIRISDEDFQNAELLKVKYNINNNQFCVIFPGAGQSYKIWPMKNYAEIADYIAQENIIPIICGSPYEKKLATEIIRYSKNKLVKDLTGAMDIPTLAALLKQSLFYIGSDTGIAHLSTSVNTPVICLIGGGHFGRFFPYGDLTRNRIVCDKNMKCLNDNWDCSIGLDRAPSPCIDGIKIDDVKNEIKYVISNFK